MQPARPLARDTTRLPPRRRPSGLHLETRLVDAKTRRAADNPSRDEPRPTVNAHAAKRACRAQMSTRGSGRRRVARRRSSSGERRRALRRTSDSYGSSSIASDDRQIGTCAGVQIAGAGLGGAIAPLRRLPRDKRLRRADACRAPPAVHRAGRVRHSVVNRCRSPAAPHGRRARRRRWRRTEIGWMTGTTPGCHPVAITAAARSSSNATPWTRTLFGARQPRHPNVPTSLRAASSIPSAAWIIQGQSGGVRRYADATRRRRSEANG